MKKVIKTRDYKFVAVIKLAEEKGFYAYTIQDRFAYSEPVKFSFSKS